MLKNVLKNTLSFVVVLFLTGTAYGQITKVNLPINGSLSCLASSPGDGRIWAIDAGVLLAEDPPGSDFIIVGGIPVITCLSKNPAATFSGGTQENILVVAGFSPFGDAAWFAGTVVGPKGLNQVDSIWKATITPRAVKQVCATYTVAGLPVTFSVFQGVWPDADGSVYSFGTVDKATWTIYRLGNASAAMVCDLVPEIPKIAAQPIQVHRLANGSFLAELLIRQDPINLVTSEVGIIAKDGSITRLISPNTNASRGTDLAWNPVTQTGVLAYIGTDGIGHIRPIDKNGNLLPETCSSSTDGGASNAYIRLGEIQGKWVAYSGSPSQKFRLERVVRANLQTGVCEVVATAGQPQFSGDISPAAFSTPAINPEGEVYFSGNDLHGGLETYKVSAPVPPPAPAISAFGASPATITVGGTSLLQWSVSPTDAKVSIDHGVGTVTGTSVTVSPTATTTYTLTATSPGGTSTAFTTVTVQAPVPVPTFTANSVVNAASFKPPCAAGSLCTIFGTNLATATAQADTTPLPTILAGTQVLVNGTPAPLLFVYPGTATAPAQINLQVPLEASGPTATMQVITPQAQSAVVIVPLSTTPGIFTGEADSVIAQKASDNSLVTLGNPAVGQDVIVVYATGLGPTACDSIKSGVPTPVALCPTLVTPDVFIGGQKATVLYAGLTPGFIGLYQLNVVVPGTRPADMSLTTTSALVITVAVNEQKSDDSAFIAIAQ